MFEWISPLWTHSFWCWVECETRRVEAALGVVGFQNLQVSVQEVLQVLFLKLHWHSQHVS